MYQIWIGNRLIMTLHTRDQDEAEKWARAVSTGTPTLELVERRPPPYNDSSVAYFDQGVRV